MTKPPKMTFGQAAKHSGFSKATISRAHKSGKLSANKLDDGSYAIDPAELQRWIDYNGHRNSAESRLATPAATPETPIQNSALQVEVEMLREKLAEMRGERDRERTQLTDQIEDLRRRLDAATAITPLLEDLRARPAPVVAERPRGFARWFGARSA